MTLRRAYETGRLLSRIVMCLGGARLVDLGTSGARPVSYVFAGLACMFLALATPHRLP